MNLGLVRLPVEARDVGNDPLFPRRKTLSGRTRCTPTALKAGLLLFACYPIFALAGPLARKTAAAVACVMGSTAYGRWGLTNDVPDDRDVSLKQAADDRYDVIVRLRGPMDFGRAVCLFRGAYGAGFDWMETNNGDWWWGENPIACALGPYEHHVVGLKHQIAGVTVEFYDRRETQEVRDALGNVVTPAAIDCSLIGSFSLTDGNAQRADWDYLLENPSTSESTSAALRSLIIERRAGDDR